MFLQVLFKNEGEGWVVRVYEPIGGPSSQMSVHIYIQHTLLMRSVNIVLRLRNSRNIMICMGKTDIFLSLKIRRTMNKNKPTLFHICVSLFSVRFLSRFMTIQVLFSSIVFHYTCQNNGTKNHLLSTIRTHIFVSLGYLW